MPVSLPAHHLTIWIDLQCGPRDPEKQSMLDDAGDGFDGGGEMGRIGDRSGDAVQDETAIIRGPGSSRIAVHRPQLGRIPKRASRFAVCDQPKATISTGSGVRAPSRSTLFSVVATST